MLHSLGMSDRKNTAAHLAVGERGERNGDEQLRVRGAQPKC